MQANAPLTRPRLLWTPDDEPGIEDVRVTWDTESVRFTSTLIRLLDGQPFHATYELVCDNKWHVRELAMAAENGVKGAHSLRLLADGVGSWTNATGQPLAALQGCIDIDFMLTPLTNTLPIRRRALNPGDSREITVVYISAPDLSVRPFRQRYTRLDDAGGARRYRYESLESGFTAELPVDDDGFVIAYPAIWRRVWPGA